MKARLNKRRFAVAALLIVAFVGAGYYFYSQGKEFVPKGTYEKADRLLLEKRARRLTLFKDDAAIKAYTVVLGRSPEGKKTEEGDNKTPEGSYIIDRRNPKSRFHLALHISYPNEEDMAQAKKRGVSPGGDIMIHGQPNLIPGALLNYDWTAGCAAVSNSEIEEIWEMVPDGVPIEIKP